MPCSIYHYFDLFFKLNLDNTSATISSMSYCSTVIIMFSEMLILCVYSFVIKWYAFEFLVVCIGKYGDIPRIPEFPHNKGPQAFQGQVLHSLDYCKLDKKAASELLKDKKVVVVGYKKSALDLAVECAEANQGNIAQNLYVHIQFYII